MHKYWRYGSWRACSYEERFSCTYIEDGKIIHICPECKEALTPTDDVMHFQYMDSIRTYVCKTCKVAYEGLPDVTERKTPMQADTPVFTESSAYSQEELPHATTTTKRQEKVYHTPTDGVPENLRYLLG